MRYTLDTRLGDVLSNAEIQDTIASVFNTNPHTKRVVLKGNGKPTIPSLEEVKKVCNQLGIGDWTKINKMPTISPAEIHKILSVLKIDNIDEIAFAKELAAELKRNGSHTTIKLAPTKL